MYTSTFLIALGLASQGAMATGWGSGKAYSCPGNTPTTCSSDQSSGFTWGQASVGQQVSSYGGCSFENTKCQASGPGGKLSKRTGGASDKCVQGPIHGSAGSCPKMSAGKNDKGAGDNFSPKTYHVSCSYDTEVDFIYSMKDGSTCKHTGSCSSGGNQVENTQCGGAVSVTCQQSQKEKDKNKGKECQMGIHSIGFQCGPATSITPPKSTPPASTASKPATTKPETTPATKPETTPATKPATTPATKPATTPATKPETTPATSVHTESKPQTETKPGSTAPPATESKPSSTAPATESKPASTAPPTESKPVTTSVPQTTAVATTSGKVSSVGVPPYQPPSNSTSKVETTAVASSKPATTMPPVSSFQTTTFMTTSTVFHTTEITVTQCAASITNCPAESKTPTVITSTLSSFVTVCPVTATMVPSGSSMVPVVSQPSNAPVSSKPVETTAVATTKPSSSAPATQPSGVPLNCPDVVPNCINTLLQTVQTECQNNADSSCFCAISNHTQFIQSCISSHGADANEVQTALSYFQGLCSPQIPQNPSIVTHQPNLQPQQPQCPSGIPATTVTVKYTTTVPCSSTTAAPVVSGSAPAAPPSMTVITTESVVTVPQVQITQAPAASGTSQPAPALVPGNGATTAAPATQGPPATQPAAAGTPAAPAVTSAAPSVPGYGSPIVASTGGVRGTGVVNPPIATGAAGKVGVSFGAFAVAAALLI